MTGKWYAGENYAAGTRRHARAVIRSFYEYHRDMHGRPLLNPFPNTKRAEDEHLKAPHNPMHAFKHPARRAPYQPKEPRRTPRGIPDQAFNELFAALPSHRDRALVALYISAGPRASEFLGVSRDRVSPGNRRSASSARAPAPCNGSRLQALNRVTWIVTCKGGTVHDVTIGDCVELQHAIGEHQTNGYHGKHLFYALLAGLGVFGPDAPARLKTVMLPGQLTPAALVDRHGITCTAIRDLLVDYLTERAVDIDYPRWRT
ncbi:hypothetical protein [Streptomyces sp. HUAS ZL42]|uniref:hypothetical protein n=1 Tax=Streptomyces sp. HUAS ZL42 TaxID=3231715 RepID=UPI00345EAEA3